MTTELAFIDLLRALATHPAARGLADDCAVLELGSETLILTHDTMVEGVHVRLGGDPADIAWKLVAVNLSDLASKGAEPLGVLLGHALGDGDARFVDGLREVLTAYDVPLLGGDTIKADGPRSWSLTALGRATCHPVPSRSGAQPGDLVYVTGTLGAAMVAFDAGAAANPALTRAYRRPEPRLSEGRALAPVVSAMMDVSDGLLLDCWRLAYASRVSIALDSGLIPVADPARLAQCLRWGDDYELLFTLPPSVQSPIPATRIGQVSARGAAALQLDGQPMTPDDGLGYEHG